MNEVELQELLKTLIEKEESEFLEFKQSCFAKDGSRGCFGDYVSAISNGACLRNEDFGYLICGVSDKTKKIVGTEIKRGELERANIRSLFNPKINYEVYDFRCENQSLLLIKIAAASGEPTFYNGQACVRIGEDKASGLKNLTTEQIKRIYNSATDWSSQIIEYATIDDLDKIAIDRARKQFKEKSENRSYLQEVDNWSDETFLDKAELTIKGKITNCSLILLGKRESRSLLKDSTASEITWELKGEKETRPVYERFYPPFLLTVEGVWSRIRNTKYLHPINQLLNIEVLKYDNETIAEALNNCIAHQYYFSNDRGITITEYPDSLIFENFGNFFEGRPEEYALGESKAKKYRNPRLVTAMINLGMIDKMGTGISKMYQSQKRRFFPMPDYSKSSSEKVVLQIYGKVIDERFSQILMERRDLDLTTTILLDHVQKGLAITNDGAKFLKKQKLIEGRKPKYFIAAELASATDQKAKYIKNKAFDKSHYKAMILQLIVKYGEASRKEIDDLLMDKLSEILTHDEKKKRIENLLQDMSRKDKTIKNEGTKRNPKWKKLGKV